MMCPDCKGTGQIEMFTSTMPCERCKQAVVNNESRLGAFGATHVAGEVIAGADRWQLKTTISKLNADRLRKIYAKRYMDIACQECDCPDCRLFLDNPVQPRSGDYVLIDNKPHVVMYREVYESKGKIRYRVRDVEDRPGFCWRSDIEEWGRLWNWRHGDAE